MSFDCVVCGSAVSIAEAPELGEIYDCEECGVELEVCSCAPVKLDVFEEEEK